MNKGLSWTEREYDYAVEKGVPVLGFVLKEGCAWKATYIDKGPTVKHLNKFKKKIQSKPVSFWENSSNLQTEVILALSKQIQSTPRDGWIRSSEGLSSLTANELARLSEENRVLRTQIADFVQQAAPDIGIEVHKGSCSLYPREDDQFNLTWRISIALELICTLRRGVAVGFKNNNLKIAIQLGNSNPMVLKTYFSMPGGVQKSELRIDGPMSFNMHGALENVPHNWDNHQDGLVTLSLYPIGYDGCYQLTIPIVPGISKGNSLEWDVVCDKVTSIGFVPSFNTNEQPS
ncbi:hypothetical protein [Prosthecobacter dejongeii]|uniref:Uncharacterized protein n=1 Tax=Prosthecobacter dejongeii TaxID=48465 RepID=A0A7W7YLE5_9BACT|nr:hypothetical protein [Prosthecobacter dejongeii]MBB5038381.1 hypothetical protein [Prosthecobacter dejongeii]